MQYYGWLAVPTQAAYPLSCRSGSRYGLSWLRHGRHRQIELHMGSMREEVSERLHIDPLAIDKSLEQCIARIVLIVSRPIIEYRLNLINRRTESHGSIKAEQVGIFYREKRA
jgi:hypothetical protein